MGNKVKLHHNNIEYEPSYQIQNRINDLNNISLTVDGLVFIISGITGTTSVQIDTKSKLNRILDNIKFLNANDKVKSVQLKSSEKEYKKIIDRLVEITEILKQNSSDVENATDSKKVADRTALLSINPRDLVDGQIIYNEDEDNFYAFNRDSQSGFVPVTTETPAPGTWGIITPDDVVLTDFTLQQIILFYLQQAED